MAVLKYHWKLTEHFGTESILLPHAFLSWHRGKNLGLELSELSVGRTLLTPPELERLNNWLFADGAWRASLLSHFEAERVLRKIIGRDYLSLCGPVSGGRWPEPASAEEILRVKTA